MHLTSLQNPRVKQVVKLRKRSVREAERTLLVEGYRELRRAADAAHDIHTLFTCETLFLGVNEAKLIADLMGAGARHVTCEEEVFRKMSYRDRPDGLLGLGAMFERGLDDLPLPGDAKTPLYLVAEAIEKPGNLGTLLRTSDAAGVAAVIVCDPTTDIHNPNVVRASVGTLFTVPCVQVGTQEALAWLKEKGITVVATTPDTETLHFDADLTGPLALAVGAEQYGLSDTFLAAADVKVRIPMHGLADSLNVAAAATIVLYESVRQRR